VILVIRELRRRDRIASIRQIDDLNEALTAARVNLIAYQEWAYVAAQAIVEAGGQPSPLPAVERVPPTPDPPSWLHGLRDRRRRRREAER
jgi:hypothetical protein